MTVQVPHGATLIIIFYSATRAIIEGWIDFSLPDFEPEGGWYSGAPHRHETNHAQMAHAEFLALSLVGPGILKP